MIRKRKAVTPTLGLFTNKSIVCVTFQYIFPRKFDKLLKMLKDKLETLI